MWQTNLLTHERPVYIKSYMFASLCVAQSFRFCRNSIRESPACSVPPPYHLTPCTPKNSISHFDCSSDTVASEPALYRLMFHVPNLMWIFLSLGCLNKESVQVRCSIQCFATRLFLLWAVVIPTPNLQAGGPPLVVCPRLFIQRIRG
jgi:hypothetical protein